MTRAYNALESPLCDSGAFSAGIFYSWRENSWVEAISRKKVTITDWFEGRPSNDTQTNSCLFFIPELRKFYDIDCWYSGFCPVCRMTKVMAAWSLLTDILITVYRISS